MSKEDKEDQLDLFGFDPKEKDLRLEEIKKIKNIAKKERAKQKQKEQKKKNKELRAKQRVVDEENFKKSIKIIKKYLSWNGDSDNKYKNLYDYTNRIESSFSQETSIKSGVNIYKFKWNLPLFSEFYKPLSKKDFIFSGYDNLSNKILCYKNMIEYCEKLLNPAEELYDYFPFDIKMKEGKKKPDWYFARDLKWKSKGYLLGLDKFKSQKIFFKREKNVVTLSWHLSDNIESINFWDDQELFDRIKYANMQDKKFLYSVY